MKSVLRKIHRWLGVLMAVQVVAWMASGLYFSLVPIEEIRGEHLTRKPSVPDPQSLARLPGPARVLETLGRVLQGDWQAEQILALSVDGTAYWKVSGQLDGQPFSRLVSAGGEMVPMLTEDQARERAENWLVKTYRADDAEWVTESEPGSEFRGRVLPVWRVRFNEPESVNLYIDPWTGELLSRRTDRWRIFDFLWMLHIMDFDGRDDFNHPLLQAAAALGLVIALSGVVYWVMTTRLFRRRKSLADA